MKSTPVNAVNLLIELLFIMMLSVPGVCAKIEVVKLTKIKGLLLFKWINKGVL